MSREVTFHDFDHLQHRVRLLEDEIARLKVVAPPMPHEVNERLDRLCSEMNAFTVEIRNNLASLMGMKVTEVPAAEVLVNDGPKPTHAVEAQIPDISTGWIGQSRN